MITIKKQLINFKKQLPENHILLATVQLFFKIGSYSIHINYHTTYFTDYDGKNDNSK